MLALDATVQSFDQVEAAQSLGVAETGVVVAAVRLNPTGRNLRFLVPLIDGELYLGDIQLTVAKDDGLSVDAARLADLLGPILVPGKIAEITAQADAGGQVSAPALALSGLELRYDPERLSLSIQLPVDSRRQRTLSYRDEVSGAEQISLKPSHISAFVNLYANMGVNQAGPGSTLSPLTIQVDSALRLGGLVVENEGYLSTRSADTLWRRTGTRLVYDDQRNTVRWTLGDTEFDASQFQGGGTVFGLGVSRIYSEIDPQQDIRATGTQTFTVMAPAIIETIVNGRILERRSIQPGNYSLRDFPVTEGANEVSLRIEDQSGKTRTINFSVYRNQSLLAQGISEFSAFAGVYSATSQSGFDYTKKWVAGGFIRRGITEQLTLGANGIATKHTQQMGLDGIAGTPLGLVGASVSASNNALNGFGLAGSLSFERLLTSANSPKVDGLRASIEWRGKHYTTPSSFEGLERTATRMAAGWVRTLSAGTFFSIDGQYSKDRYPGRSSYGIRVAGGIPLHPRLELNPEIGTNRKNAQWEAFGRLSIRMRLRNGAGAQLDLDNKGNARANITGFRDQDGRRIQYSGDVSRIGDMLSANADLNFTTSRANLTVEQMAMWNARSGKLENSQTSIRTAISLAWAGGALALGQPVTDAFLIARPHRSLEGKQVRLDPSSVGAAASSGDLGPALLSQLAAHNRRTIIYDVPDAPPGYDLGAGNVTVRPAYKSGYMLEIGSDFNLTLFGRLLDRSGEPVRLLAGEAFEVGNREKPPITLFTSRDGRFGAQGLRAGRWRIEMPADEPLVYEVEVAEGPQGTVRVGDLNPIANTAVEGRSK